MSDCIDPQYKDMLHAWELGMLSEEERQKFELHLLECDACSEEASQFLPATRLLARDLEFRPSADELAESKSVTDVESLPFRKNLMRLLLVAAAIIVVAIPIYRWTLTPGGESGPVQQLKLVPMRNAGDNAIRRDVGGMVEIYFYSEGAANNGDHRVVVASERGDTVYSNNHFTTFSKTGTGAFVLPATAFDTGFYELTVKAASDSASTSLQIYHFRVE